ncbi:uncharacterized protein LOC113385492 [Ctenocephalides felis]|uniref:uncharacterized protein LOC113385492 n=1 Tax=Ctenocephalides felis TaxID=7515 RepID=UPI000E6E3E87|nr:uncharacterized protein LOC113385492 [Ctenocephalides felis]
MWVKENVTTKADEIMKELKYYQDTDECGNKEIEDISSIGKNRIKIIFNNYKSANKVIRDEMLDVFNINAYIPRHKLVRLGIIFDIDPSLDEEEILSSIRSESEIISIRCLKSKNNESTKTNSQRVKILFKGNMLPERVFIHSVSCRVSPFIQRLIQCHNCWRFGHIKSQCKSKERCKKCTEEHKIEACKSDIELCSLCHDNHRADDKNCEVYLKNKRIKEIMALQNTSYIETKKIIQYNRYAKAASTFSHYKSYQSHFPEILSNIRNDSVHSNINRYDILSDLKEKEELYDRII